MFAIFSCVLYLFLTAWTWGYFWSRLKLKYADEMTFMRDAIVANLQFVLQLFHSGGGIRLIKHMSWVTTEGQCGAPVDLGQPIPVTGAAGLYVGWGVAGLGVQSSWPGDEPLLSLLLVPRLFNHETFLWRKTLSVDTKLLFYPTKYHVMFVYNIN